MIKMIGLILIVTSCSIMGLTIQREMEKRKITLKAHISALQVIRTEILYKNTPMDQIVPKLTESSGEAAAGFYQTFFAAASSGLALSSAMRSHFDLLQKDGLFKEDIEEIRTVCRVLGQYDSVTQAEHIAASVDRLEGHLRTLQSELSSKGRIYKTVGAAIGIVLAIVVA